MPASRTFGELFGWKRLDGIVIHETPQHLGHVRKEWWETGLKLTIVAALIFVFGLTAIVVMVSIAVIALLISIVSKPRQRPSSMGVLSTIASQVASSLILSRLFGSKATVPVRDYRLRDASGTEWLVRIEGHITHGAIAIGDDVAAEGFLHEGTLIFRRGWNKRLNCAVRVRRA